MRQLEPEGNEQKFRELVLYISEKCANDQTFGAVKLNKILYYSDFLAYALHGQPITGLEYQKLPNGPAPRRLLPIREAMVEDGDLVLEKVQLWSGNFQHRTVGLREPDLALFEPREIALVDEIIQKLWGRRAEEVSELSHRMVGWKVTSDNETIPYHTVFLSDQPLTEMEIQRGLEIAERYGLMVGTT